MTFSTWWWARATLIACAYSLLLSFFGSWAVAFCGLSIAAGCIGTLLAVDYGDDTPASARWAAAIGALVLPASLVHLWWIRDQETAIPLAGFGGLILSLALLLVAASSRPEPVRADV